MPSSFWGTVLKKILPTPCSTLFLVSVKFVTALDNCSILMVICAKKMSGLMEIELGLRGLEEKLQDFNLSGCCGYLCSLDLMFPHLMVNGVNEGQVHSVEATSLFVNIPQTLLHLDCYDQAFCAQMEEFCASHSFEQGTLSRFSSRPEFKAMRTVLNLMLTSILTPVISANIKCSPSSIAIIYPVPMTAFGISTVKLIFSLNSC